MTDRPPVVWRNSNYTDLNGRGGLIASGRWHTRRQSILYCSDEARTAYREVLRHVQGMEYLIPDGHKLLKIKIPSFMDVEVVDIGSLDPSWRSAGISGWPICQAIGDEWLSSH